ncbi:MAG: amidohydrolase family protein [Chitinivibrionales bacterium]|nr:amidohydrolase family protein [Chitinivibrionales bacterium]
MGTAFVPIPGFVDLQVNGFRGVDFSSPDLRKRDFVEACRHLLASGTAAFLPTIITSPPEVYERNLRLMSDAMRDDAFQGALLGIHAEGPFISAEPGAVGAHQPQWVQAPDPAFLDKMIEWAGGRLRLLTVAPELDDAHRLIAHAVRQGIVVSVGHSLADASALLEASQAGASALTHFGNGVPENLPRHPNPLWAGLANDRLWAMLITDGHHLPAELIKTAIRTKGVDHVVVTSDAAPPTGLPPGTYETLGNTAVLDEHGKLYNPRKGCLVGSSATMLQCMNYLASLGLVTLDDLLAMGYYNPLKLLDIDTASIRLRTRLSYCTTTQLFVVESG